MTHRIARLSSLCALILLGAASGARAQPLPPPGPSPVQVSLYSEARAEWVRPDDAGLTDPEPVLTLVHRHGGEAAGVDGPLSLRGSFALERNVALTGPSIEGLALDAALDAELALGDDTVLRGGFSLAYGEDSGPALILGTPVATRSDNLDLQANFGLAHRFGETLIALDAGISAARVGDTRFSGAALRPQRLLPESDRMFAALSLEHALTPSLAALARAEADRLSVFVPDSVIYGRLPVDRLRASAGLRARPSPSIVAEFELGADALFGDVLALAASQEIVMRPYGYGLVGLTLREGVALTFTAQAGTRLDEPADGLADWRWRLDAQGSWQVDPRLSVFASLYGEGGEAVLVPVDLVTELGGEAGLRFAVAPGVTLTATAGHARDLAPDGLADLGETRLALSIRAEL